jgi:hypothetical protein
MQAKNTDLIRYGDTRTDCPGSFISRECGRESGAAGSMPGAGGPCSRTTGRHKAQKNAKGPQVVGEDHRLASLSEIEPQVVRNTKVG